MTRFWLLLLYVIPAVLLAVGTAVFLINPQLDLVIARKFYLAGAVDRWHLGVEQPWAFLYSFSAFPAIVVSALAFCILVLGIGRPRLSRHRKTTTYLLSVLVLGPGLIVNGLMKEYWGRPRPNNLTEFGSDQAFEGLLRLDPETAGKSFGCGHATMGFFFLALAFILLAAGRRKAGWFVFLGALVYGSLIGAARVIQGSHWTSDVLWAGGVVWLSAGLLFQLFRLHQGVSYEPKNPVGATVPRWVTAVTAPVLLVLIFGVCLAWPYNKTRESTVLPKEFMENPRTIPTTVFLDLDLEGAVELERGDTILVTTEAVGIGFPKSSLYNDRVFIDSDDAIGAEIKHRRKGRFTKLDARTRVTLLPNRTYKIKLSSRVTEVYLIAEGKRDPNNFAEVLLISGFSTELKNFTGDVVEEDFFGNQTRRVSF